MDDLTTDQRKKNIDRFGSTPETLRLDSPEMQAAMRQYHALEKFSCKQNWWGDSIQKFAEGKTAMTVIYSNYAAELINSGNSVVVGRVGAAILPGCKPLLGGGIVGISRYSQKAEACKQFFHWYYSADVASLLVRLGGTSPIVDAYEDFQNYSIFPWMNTSKKSFGLGQRGVINQAPERFSIPKYEFAVGTAVRNVVQDLMTPADASRMAQALYDAADPVCRYTGTEPARIGQSKAHRPEIHLTCGLFVSFRFSVLRFFAPEPQSAAAGCFAVLGRCNRLRCTAALLLWLWFGFRLGPGERTGLRLRFRLRLYGFRLLHRYGRSRSFRHRLGGRS